MLQKGRNRGDTKMYDLRSWVDFDGGHLLAAPAHGL